MFLKVNIGDMFFSTYAAVLKTCSLRHPRLQPKPSRHLSSCKEPPLTCCGSFGLGFAIPEIPPFICGLWERLAHLFGLSGRVHAPIRPPRSQRKPSQSDHSLRPNPRACLCEDMDLATKLLANMPGHVLDEGTVSWAGNGRCVLCSEWFLLEDGPYWGVKIKSEQQVPML